MGVGGNDFEVGWSNVAVCGNCVAVGGIVSDGRYVAVLLILVRSGGVLEQHSF